MKQIGLTNIAKIIAEFIPIVVFITLFELTNFFIATQAMILAVFVSIIVLYRTEKRIPYFGILVSIITVIFAILTVITRNKEILMFRDTVYDFFFAVLILIGLAENKLVLKKLFSHIQTMSDYGWKQVSYVWAVYFCISGFSNEIVRHSGRVSHWIHFKIGIMAVTSLLGIWTLYYAKLDASRRP